MRGHPLTTEPPLSLFGDRSGGSSNRKDGQKMTYRQDNRPNERLSVTKCVRLLNSPSDRAWVASGFLLLVLAAGLGLCLSCPVYAVVLAETAADMLVKIGAQIGTLLVVCGLAAAGGAR